MKPFKSLRIAALLATTACFLPAQAAFVFTDVGQSVTTQFSGTSQGVNLAASVTYTLSSYNTTLNNKNAVFNVTVNNGTAAQAGSNRLASFGVDVISPSLTSVSDTFSGFQSTRGVSFQGASNTVDLCLYAGGSCSNVSNSGVSEASSQTGSMTLGFANTAFGNGFSVSFAEPYYVRFVGVGSGDDDENEVNLRCISSASCATALSAPNAVPEPASLALVGAALLAMGALTRRRNRA